MPTRAFLVFLMLGLACGPAVAQRAAGFAPAVRAFVVADAPQVLIHDARLFDGASPAVGMHQDVLLRDGRIAAIGAHLAVPAGAQVVDARGRTLMPGLVFVHEHLLGQVMDGSAPLWFTNPYIAQVMLASGVTTARTAGGDTAGDLRLKRAITEGKRAGPDLDVSVYIDGPKGIYIATPLADAEAARREVDYWADRGATSAKLFFGATPEIAAVTIREAHARGMNVAAHLCATHAVTAARLGLDSLEHGLWAAYDLVPEAQEGQCATKVLQPAMFQRLAQLDPEGPEVGAVLQELLQHHVAMTPTLSVQRNHLCGPTTPPPAREQALLPPANRSFDPPVPCFPGLTLDIELRAAHTLAAIARRFHAMGGTLLAGTDGGLVPGAEAPSELEALVAAGLSPADVLRIATVNGARVLRRERDIGTVQVGKRGDLLLIDGEPDHDIQALRHVVTVFRDGIGYDPQRLYEDARERVF